ncbi:hypothetical protein [Campylobacter helveticus]|nr:hypothetical protein [Campylobacter helveticus]
MLFNAKVPPKYYDIFYNMLALSSGSVIPPPPPVSKTALNRLWSACWAN